MTRIVVLNHYPCWPPQIGGQQAVLGLAGELAAAWPTTLVWLARRAAGPLAVQAGGRTLAASAVPSRWLQRHSARWLRRGLGRVDTEVGTMLFAAGHRVLVDHLAAALADGDVLVLAHPWLWPAAERLLQRRRVRLVYDAHNIEHVMKREALARTRTAAWVVERVRRLERALVQRADLTLACTPADADALAALAGVGPERLFVGSKGVAPSPQADAVAQARAVRLPGRTAVFVGSNHPPNNEAARWIIQTLAPAMPGWRFDIAGACGPAAGVAQAPANVRVLGRVDDLPALLAEADLALNPVTEGSGINMKLFDYQQHGLPVLSTPFGARGFEGLGPTGIATAERAGSAAAMAALDGPALQRLGAEGAACVARHFVWPVVGERVRGRLAAMMAA